MLQSPGFKRSKTAFLALAACSFFALPAQAFEEYEYIDFNLLGNCSSFQTLTGDGSDVCLTLPAYAGSSHPAIAVKVEMSGFSGEQTSKVRGALAVFSKNWYAFAKGGFTQGSAFGNCLKEKTMYSEFPASLNFPEAAKTKEAGVSYSMLKLQYMFEYHAETRRPIVIRAGRLDGAVGWAYLGNASQDEYGDIHLNTDFLDDSGYSSTYIAGTIIHEWLHRQG